MARKRWVTGLLVVCVAAVVPLAGAGGAVGDPNDGLWYYDRLGVAAANAQGADGHGVVVANIDSNINLDLKVLQGASIEIGGNGKSFCEDYDPATGGGIGHLADATSPLMTFSVAHGSNTTAMIVGNGRGEDGGASVRGIAPKATVRFYSSGIPWEDTRVGGCSTADSIVAAVRDGAKIISIQAGGSVGFVRAAVAWALNQGVVVLAGLPESFIGGDLPGSSSGELNGVVGVQAIGADGQVIIDAFTGHPFPVLKVSVAAPGVDVIEQGILEEHDWSRTALGSGTSYATPITAGVLAAVWSAFPDSTPNQVLQSLLRHTGGYEHDLIDDPATGYGYGVIDLLSMLADDPAQYPDVNPLIRQNPNFDGDLSAADIEAAVSPDPFSDVPEYAPGNSPAPSPSSTSKPAPAPSPAFSWWAWVVGAGVVCVVVLVAVLAGITLAGRRRRLVVPPVDAGGPNAAQQHPDPPRGR